MTAHRALDGSPEPPGVTISGSGVNVAVWAAHASAVWFCLFDAAGCESARIRLSSRTGDVHHAWIDGVGEGARYGFRAAGPSGAPHAFDPAKLLVDPDAVAIDRPFTLAPSLFPRPANDAGPGGDSANDVPMAIVTLRPLAREPRQMGVADGRRVIYELNARAFTRLHPYVPADVRGTLKGLVAPAPLRHLTELGVTTVELMPLAAWIDERHLQPLGLTNAWGYNPVLFGVPDPRIVPGGWSEVRETVDRLHEAGLEVILDVVLNHTGESDGAGPTLSLRGLDQAGYYRMDGAGLVNHTGCGNTLALDRPHVIRLVMDSLRRWVLWGGIDGFRFDLATTLGRRGDGFDPQAPLITAILQDPVLRRAVLIAEPWDLGPDGYRLGGFPSMFGEWNDRFRDGVRRFWRGDAGTMGELATRLAGSADVFGASRPARSVNFVTAHDGFTLADLVSYRHKRNEANGEHNRDGRDESFSWNNGVEGDTSDPEVRARRARDQRNLLATLMLARGTPLIAMGSELGHSQKGNNNAYAQDNETTWIDWSRADQGLLAFTRELIAMRRGHPALHRDRFLTGTSDSDFDLPDVTWLTPDGTPMRPEDWQDAERRCLIVRLAATDPGGRPDVVLAVFNAGAAAVPVTLPPVGGAVWRCLLDTSDLAVAQPTTGAAGADIVASPRSVALFAAAEDIRTRTLRPSSDELGRLAAAAGIAAEWWEISGRRHLVTDDTKRALLAAMGLAAATRGDFDTSRERVARERVRLLPRCWAAVTGRPIDLPVQVMPSRRISARWVLRDEAGSETGLSSISIALAETGAGHGRYSARLPSLQAGRYDLLDPAHPADVCRLVVAPPRCWLPADLEAGQLRFGLSAQLYGLRRAGDQGIGDFTTLAELARHAAQAGASTVAINPLHALFAHDRSRASPYYPSDRRFLDPISIDVAALPKMLGSESAAKSLVAADRELEALRASALVDYERVWSVKRSVLSAAFAERHEKAWNETFRAWVARAGAVAETFADFEAAQEEEGRGRPGAHGGDRPARATGRDFALFLQWVADVQLAAAAEAGRRAGLAHGIGRDLAVGAAPGGSEVQSGGALFATGVSLGAPPDAFAASGQVWGLVPWSPAALLDRRLAPFSELIDANVRHAGLLRIDHILGLTRQFWVPDGAKGSDGAYVAFPEALLHAELSLASHRAHCVMVGEDLGTLPEGLRGRLTERRILGMAVMPFERTGDGLRRPADYPTSAIACAATHDLPPLAGWWAGHDIREQKEIGLLDPNMAEAARRQRADDKRALLSALASEGLWPAATEDDASDFDDRLAAAIHAYIAATPAPLLLAQVEDLAGATTAVNIPGTDRERPNWRWRVRSPLGEIFEGTRGAAIVSALGRRSPEPS